VFELVVPGLLLRLFVCSYVVIFRNENMLKRNQRNSLQALLKTNLAKLEKSLS